MAIPLVHMLPNSITLVLDGNWHIIPGDNTMNNTTATTTGPQSASIISPSQFYSGSPLDFNQAFLGGEGAERRDKVRSANVSAKSLCLFWFAFIAFSKDNLYM
ncbi:hypothetical protein V6N13_145636 [Hibiscus sabdariffa]|uniref:Uncharacterized protein n=1 Tax=Hibiscus sabdariffa TaxID=183260 RepID=A0ABR2TQN9_9ROSI